MEQNNASSIPHEYRNLTLIRKVNNKRSEAGSKHGCFGGLTNNLDLPTPGSLLPRVTNQSILFRKRGHRDRDMSYKNTNYMS